MYKRQPLETTQEDVLPTGGTVKVSRWFFANTKRYAVRRVLHTVNASDGPGGFITHVVLRDRINFNLVNL